MTSIHDVESQLDLNAFVYKGVNVWPCLRRIIGWELIVARSDKSTVAKKRPSRLAAILRLIYSFKDVYKLFYSYEAISKIKIRWAPSIFPKKVVKLTFKCSI